MPYGGARDTDWTHVRLEGDRERAVAFMPAARVLLGAVKQAAEAGALQTMQTRRELEPGVELLAEVRGGIPRVTIRVEPPKKASRSIFDLRGFLSWPSNAANPDGFDAEHPQAVYSPPGAELGRDKWRTYLYRAFASVWSAIGVSKRTYRAQGGEAFLPNGAKLFGNHRWTDGDGLYLSWFAPESGCIVNGAEPHWLSGDDRSFPVDLFYGTAVFYGGELLYDTRNVTGTGSHTIVGGACVRRILGESWLYVAQWTIAFDSLRVVRARIVPGAQRSGVYRPRIDDNVEVVFTAPLPVLPPEYDRAWAHPVRFSQDGSTLAVYVAAGDPYSVGSFTAAEINAWFAPSPSATEPALAVALRPADARVVFATDTGSYELQTYTTSYAAPALGPIAGDYVANVLREVYVEHPAGLQAHHTVGGWYVFGAQRIPVAEQSALNAAGYRRDVVCLAPGDDRYLFLRTQLSAQDAGTASASIVPSRQSWLELWSGGGMMFEVDLGTYDGSTFGVGNLVGLTTPVSIPSAGVTNGRVFDLTHGAFAAYGFGPFHSVSPSGRYGASSSFSPSATLRPYFQHFRPASPIPADLLTLNWVLSPFVRPRRCAESIFCPYPEAGTPVTLTFGGVPVNGTLSYSGLGFWAWNPFNPAPNRSFTRAVPEGGAHGRLRSFSGEGMFEGNTFEKADFPLTRALCRVGDATLVSCAWFGQPDASVVAVAPAVGLSDLTGLSQTQLRLHPAVALGTKPLFEVT